MMRTIRMLLSASQENRQYLWSISIIYTLLLNQLIQKLTAHDKFQEWQTQGAVPQKAIQSLCNKLSETEEFSKLPARIRTSAVLLVSFMFKSWLAIQKKRQQKLDGKRRWLKVMMDAFDLQQSVNFSQETIRGRATEVLEEIQIQREAHINNQNDQGAIDEQSEKVQPSLMTSLFDASDTVQDPLDRIAIAYLLRNDCKVDDEDEDPDKVMLRYEKKGIEIERLEKELRSRLPDGRDPTGERTQQFMEEAIAFAEHSAWIPNCFWLRGHSVMLTSHSPSTGSLLLWACVYVYQWLKSAAEFEAWEKDLPRRMANLLTQLESRPYPFIFASTDDLYWSWEPENLSTTAKDLSSRSTVSTGSVQKNHKRKRCRTRKRRKQLTERACVRFKSKGLSHLCFKVECGRRQLPAIKQSVNEAQELKARDDNDKFSTSLLPIRSACLLWEKDKQQLHKKNHWKLQKLWLKWFGTMSDEISTEDGEFDLWFNSLVYLCLSTRIPWNTHRLYLHCTVDSRLLTAEGTEEVRQEKLAEAHKTLEKIKMNLELAEKHNDQQSDEDKGDSNISGEEEELSEKDRKSPEQKRKDRQAAINRTNSTLARLGNPTPVRPPRQTLTLQPQIVLGVCFSWKNIVGVAVVDTGTQQVLEYQNVRDLLTDKRLDLLEERAAKVPEGQKGKRSTRQLQLKDYRLINRWRKKCNKNLTQRSEQQRHGLYAESNQESNSAKHLNRVIAKKILLLGQKWQAGGIILPNFGNVRESIECEIQAKARRKFPDDNVKLQKEYAKKLRMNVHRWKHRDLVRCIRDRVACTAISVMTGKQPKEGTLREKTIAMVISR